jgi:hypothetical protein
MCKYGQPGSSAILERMKAQARLVRGENNQNV